jgi:hypothetical protein
MPLPGKKIVDQMQTSSYGLDAILAKMTRYFKELLDVAARRCT